MLSQDVATTRNSNPLQTIDPSVETYLQAQVVPLSVSPNLNQRINHSNVPNSVLQILSFVAETEREHIKARQREGIAAAKARGVKFGRPKLDLPPCFGEVVRRFCNREITLRNAASLCGMSPTSFWRKSRK